MRKAALVLALVAASLPGVLARLGAIPAAGAAAAGGGAVGSPGRLALGAAVTVRLRRRSAIRCSTPVPPPQRVLASWQEAVALLRARSTDLQIALDQVLQAEAQTRIALAQYLPTIIGSGSYTHQLITNRSPAASLTRRPAPRSSRRACPPRTSSIGERAAPRRTSSTSRSSIRSASTSSAKTRRASPSTTRSARSPSASPTRSSPSSRPSGRRDQPRGPARRARAGRDHRPQAGPRRGQRARRGPRAAERGQRARDARHRATSRSARRAKRSAWRSASPRRRASRRTSTSAAWRRTRVASCRTVVQRRRARRRRGRARRSSTSPSATCRTSGTRSSRPSPRRARVSGHFAGRQRRYPNPTWNIQGVLQVPIWDGGTRYGNLRNARAAEDIAAQQLEALQAAGDHPGRAGAAPARRRRAVGARSPTSSATSPRRTTR